MSARSRVALIPALFAAGCSRPPLPRDIATRDAATAADKLAPPAAQAVPNAASRGKSVVVNIPAFELIAFEDGSEVFRSRVIVGRIVTPTPELVSPLHAVQFNPSWTPTPAMIVNEGARPMPPGPRNPLGRILFELDNDELIYLHDTNDRSLFARSQRALSHGCIRVERAHDLAAWALGIPEAEVNARIAAGATRTFSLAEPIPVSLIYAIHLRDSNGQMTTYPDIYGHERP
jgi:murein L,D-transpeptidase YcbB/YkuD